ncbi:porin [Niastella populi]|uniref:Porin n=1 Tax=Niastella populi TaxID=550983 RepID=A0A1V9GDJ0_9BACT|nr:porin [Niastella populi]OQP68612.1 porin [Niastella populi]
MNKIIVVLLAIPSLVWGQTSDSAADANKDNPWYKRFTIRGYVQVRYNRLLETNPNLKNDQGDKSIGKNGGMSIRRARIILSGQLNNHVYFYFQPDFAASPSSDDLHFGQIRDAYIDVSFDKKREYRVRLGQSKVPYGFEAMQSSSNRMPLDRSDGINSAFVNERDLGAYFYYAPAKIRARFAWLLSEGLKGSGDYGVAAFGVLNGQGANRPEKNEGMHVVARLSYPFAIKKQIIEAGIQAYSGMFTLTDRHLSGKVKIEDDHTYEDKRVAASFILYPQPFGFQAEYNIGRGPQYDPALDSIVHKSLQGGYVMASFRKKINRQVFIPFSRFHYYDGGKKFEQDARAYLVRELEIGLEWQPSKYFELVAMYTISHRRTADFMNENNDQKGNLLRLQAQLNF